MPLEAPRLRRRNPESLPDPDSNRGRPTKATVHNEWGYKGRAISIRLPFITRCSRFRRVSDRRVNAKRGLNRLFVALTVLWASLLPRWIPFSEAFRGREQMECRSEDVFGADARRNEGVLRLSSAELSDCGCTLAATLLLLVGLAILARRRAGRPACCVPALLCARRCLSLGRARV